MKMTSLLVAGSMVLAGAVLTTASAQTTDPILAKLATDYSVAFNKGDAKAVAALHTEKAVRVTATGSMIGRGAIEKAFAASFAGPYKGAKIKIIVGTTQNISADVAVGDGTYELSGLLTADGQPSPVVNGRYLNALVKQGGAWLIAGNAAIVIPPPAK